MADLGSTGMCPVLFSGNESVFNQMQANEYDLSRDPSQKGVNEDPPCHVPVALNLDAQNSL